VAATILKIQNRDIVPIATKFGMVTQFGTYDASHSQNFVISKIQQGSRRNFEKSKNRHSDFSVFT